MPMSGSAKIFHIAPTTFHGIRSGRAISTRQTETHGPLRGIASAIATPSGTSIARMMPVKASWRSSDAWKRSECSTCSNHFTPSKKKMLFPKVSCTE
jgi:hypothetical protein